MPETLTLEKGLDGVWRVPAPRAPRPDLDEWLQWRIRMRREFHFGAIPPETAATIFPGWYGGSGA